MGGLDVLRLLRIIAERPADLTHAHLERRVADKDARPDPVHELVFGDEAAGVLCQILEDAEGLRRQRYGRSVSEENGVRLIEAELSEDERPGG